MEVLFVTTVMLSVKYKWSTRVQCHCQTLHGSLTESVHSQRDSKDLQHVH